MLVSKCFMKSVYLLFFIKYVSSFIKSISLDHSNTILDKEKEYWKINNLIDYQKNSIKSIGVSAWFRVSQVPQNNTQPHLLSIYSKQCKINYVLQRILVFYQLEYKFHFLGEKLRIILVGFDRKQYNIQIYMNSNDLQEGRINNLEINKWYLLVIIESDGYLFQILSFEEYSLKSIQTQKFHNQPDIFKDSLKISFSHSSQLMTKDINFYSSQQKIIFNEILNIENQDTNCRIINFLKRFYFDKMQIFCFRSDQYFKSNQTIIIKDQNQIVESIISSFYLNDFDIDQYEEELLFKFNNQLSILIININNNLNLAIQILDKQYHIGLIENLQNQIILQIEYENQYNQCLIIHYYSNEMLKNIINVNHIINESNYKGNKHIIQQYQHQNDLISNLFVYINFKLNQKHQQINKCILEANSISQNDKIQQICIFRFFQKISEQSIEIPLIQKNHQRNLVSTIVFIHGSNMRSIVKKMQQNQESKYIISSVQSLGTFMVIGYFKLTQAITSSQPPLPLITIGVQSEFYNFLNLYIIDSTKVELKYIHDASNIIKKQSSGTLSNFKDKWISFGIVYSGSDSKAKIVYNTISNAILLQSTAISSAILPSTITKFDVCISCNIQGGIFNQFSGQVSSVKIIFDVNFTAVNEYYFFNEATTINKSTILNDSFNSKNYVSSNEYDVGQGFNCNSGNTFFESICIEKNNCKNIAFESDIYESFETGKFFDSLTNKCLSCGSNCLQCASNTICTQCRPGYKLNSDKCIRCNDQNKCSSSCPFSQVFDPINQICIDSFNISSQILLNPLVSSRIINDNTDIEVVPPFASANDIIIHCYLDIDNNPITLHSFLGGIQFTSSILLKKQWSTVPKGYQKSVSFYVLFYGSGNPSNLLVKINSNTAILDSNYETIASNKISCSGSSSLTQSIFKVKFTIQDYQTFFNLEIQSDLNGWGIRNLNIEILKCHSTCDSCKSGGSAYDCTTCKSDMLINKFQCNCPEGQYAKYNNCFDSPCVICSSCTISNCQKCEDITGNCIQCNQDYSILDGQCIQDVFCNTKNAKYFNYCGIQSEDAFIHFNQNKILQFTDYWRFNSNNFTMQSYNSQKFLSLIGKSDQHSLTMNLPNYQSYHYMLGFKILILAHQSVDTNDYAQIIVNNVQVFKKSYSGLKGTWSDKYFSESVKFLNDNEQMYFRFVSKTDDDLDDEGFSFSQLEFSYYRCHPICSTCNDVNEASCTQCIDNAYKKNGSCQCKDGFYFYLARYYAGSTPPGSCLQCNSSCKTCNGPSYQDCLQCKDQDGYKPTNNTCLFTCKEGEYWDQTSQSCLKCHPCCRTCDGDSNTDCHDCNPDYSFRVQDNSCLIFNAKCQACTVAVNSLCGGDQSTHDICFNNGWRLVNEKSCLNCGKYFNNQCGGDQTQEIIEACIEQGFQNYDSNNCSPCSDIQSDNCGRSEIKDICKSKGWTKFDSKICKNCHINSPTFKQCVCHSTCEMCTQYFDPKACSTCQPSFYFFKNQCLPKCPNGHIIKGNECIECNDEQMPTCINCYKTCLICNPFKESNISNSCTQCSNLTRKFLNGKCLCQDNEDNREIFFECSYQNIAVLNAILSNIDSVLKIDFGKILVFPNGQQQNSQELCLYLFTAKTIQLLGSTSLCTIQDMFVIVNLVEGAEVFNGDFIYFNENILSFKTPLTQINKYMNNIVVQDKIIETSKVQFNWTPIENSCNDFNFEFKQIVEGAKRGFRNFNWSIKSFIPNDSSLYQALQFLLQKANTDKILNIQIPKGIIQLGTNVIILFTYTLKANVDSFEEFSLSVKAEKKIQINFQTSIIFPLFRYQSGLVIASIVVKMCEPNGDIIFTEPVDFSITSVEYPDINYANPTFNQQDYVIELKSYSFPTGNIILNVHAKLLSNLFIESKADFKINSQQTDLLIKITGGDGYFNYKKEAIIEGKVRDLDIKKEDDPQGINLSWECVDQNTSQTCKSKVGNTVAFPNDQSIVKIDAFTFNPYTTIKVTLIGNKSPRQSKSTITVLFSELDLPPLRVNISVVDPRSETVNLNEQIFVILNYSSSVNVDLLSFSGTLSYENEVVGIIKFDYSTLRFQIWNYYNNFKKNSKDLQIRFSVFNPKYFMPSMFMSTLTLNFPPNNCKFGVTPTNGGYSLETKFMIIFQDCKDENKPILYQFFFYKDQKDFKYENENPLQVLRRQISDKQQNPIAFTSLPPGQILILGQAIDSKNAIYNTTIAITVEKKQYDEQHYLSIIQQKQDQISKVSNTDAIQDLSILCDDILQRTEFKQSSQLNQKKIEIINELNKLQTNLPPLSSFSTVIDKATKSLIRSGIAYNNSQQTDLLNKLIDTLEETSDLKQSSLELSQEKLKQKLFDTFQVIDSLGQFSSDTESGTKYLELSNKIGQKLFKNILPNEDPIYFKGDNLSILGFQMTEKYICSYFLCENVNSAVDESKTTTIHNFKKIQYNKNPYQQDASFLNYTNSLKVADPNLKITNYPVINPSISTQLNVPINKLQQEVILNFPIQENIEQKKLICLSKDSNNQWTKSGCNNKLYSKELNTIKCVCSSLSPTTIIDDLEDLLSNNNIGTAFSSDGILNLANFDDFYKYVAFWILFVQTISFYIFYIKGQKLDQLEKNELGNQDLSNIKPAKQQQNQVISKNKVVPMSIFDKNQKSIKVLNIQNEILEEKEVIINRDILNEENFKDKQNIQINDKYNSNQNINTINMNSQSNQQHLLTQFSTQENELLKTQFQTNDNSPKMQNIQDFDHNEFQKQVEEKLNRQNSPRTPRTPRNPENLSKSLQVAKKNQSNNKNYEIIRKQSSNIEKKSYFNLIAKQISEKNTETDSTILKSDDQQIIQKDNNQNIDINNEDIDKIFKRSLQKQLTTISEYQNSFHKLSKSKQILIFHNFFGIFFLYNPDIPRSLRLLIFYIRSIHSLAISVVFDKSYSIVQKIAIAVINSVLIIIVIKILSKSFSMKSKIGIVVSRIIILIFIATYYYIILSIISGQTPSDSNQFIGTFTMFYLGDIFVISFISAFCQKIIAQIILRKKIVKGIFSFLYKAIELQLVLLQLK